MNFLGKSLYTVGLIALMACSDDNAPETPKPETPDTPEGSVESSVTINLGEKYQIMEGFGASSCTCLCRKILDFRS